MTDSEKKVKIKLEIKGSPNYKFEYKGRLDEALKLTRAAIDSLEQNVSYLKQVGRG